MFELLNQGACDEHLKIFGGVTVISKLVADLGRQNWVASLESAVARAKAAANFSKSVRMKARRSRVNSRWRDALVKLTEAMEYLLASRGELNGDDPTSLQTTLNQHDSTISMTERFLIPTLGDKEEDLKTIIFRKLCLSRARVLRQVGLWQEAMNEIEILLTDRKMSIAHSELLENQEDIWQASP